MENIPDFLIKKIEEQYGKDILNKILEGYSKKRKTTFRVNTIKATIGKIEEELRKNNINFERVGWSKEAFILKDSNEEVLQNLDIYKNGEIYIQSLSSMIPPIVLDPKEGEDILHMAAAPGGKTTQIAAISNNNAHITACEINSIRAERLKYNIEKQGANSVYVMIKDARTIDDFFSFDKVLLDSPCSGSGTLNINNEKNGEIFTENQVQKLIKTQTQLLKKAIKILKPGKEMIYSTCSILKDENEEILNSILDKNIEIVPIKFEGINELPMLPTIIEGTICICPDEYYEGFFVAKIRKN